MHVWERTWARAHTMLRKSLREYLCREFAVCLDKIGNFSLVDRPPSLL